MRQHVMAKNTAKTSTHGLKLGSLVKDSITGFTGIATARTEFAYGCVHIRIQAQSLTEEGDPVPVHDFDDQRIEVLAPPSKKWPEPKKSKITLGDIVRDTFTGAVGTATSRTVGIDGSIKLIVEQSGLTKDGEPRPAFYTVIERLEIVDKRELTVSETSAATSGGPMCRQVSDLE